MASLDGDSCGSDVYWSLILRMCKLACGVQDQLRRKEVKR